MIWLLTATFVLTPAYALRFGLFGLPLNVLMVWIAAVWLTVAVYLIAKKQVGTFLDSIKNTDKPLLVAIALFFLAATVSLLVKGVDQKKIGEWLVFFVQPMSLFFIVHFFTKDNPKLAGRLGQAAYLMLALAGILAAVQYFTLYTLPPLWWGNSVEPKRAVAFFIHPDFYALWAAPLLAFLIPDVASSIQYLKVNGKLLIVNCLKVLAWIFGGVGLLLSLSRGGWLGLTAAVAVYLIVAANKKIRRITLWAAAIVIIVVAVVPNWRYRVILPFLGEKSAVSRLSLWHTGIKAISESPITGLGLTGFSNNWLSLNTDPNLDTHNFPHNIFLDLWVETGLLGLLSMAAILGWAIIRGLKNKHSLISLGVALFMIALVVQGQVDNPYFKNDLALVFWMILALMA